MKFIKLASLFIVPILLSLGCLSTLVAFHSDPAAAVSSVKDLCTMTDVPDEVKAASGCSSVSSTLPELDTVIQSIVNGVIAVAGTVAVIFIVVGGFNYMTSASDPSKIQKAKNTIMYACIGLAICALSFIIVNFVIVDLIAGGSTATTDGTGVETVGENVDGAPVHNLPELVQAILNGVIAVLGTVCVIVMIVGGTNFMTSAGDTQKVTKARNTLIYGAIGLVICVLSFMIVNFVVRNILHGDQPTGVPAVPAILLHNINASLSHK